MKTALLTITSILVILLQYRLWFSEASIPTWLVLRHSVKVQQQENEALATRNQVLSAEVIDLKSGLEAIDERARSSLGMIKKGETFFQIIPEKGEK